MKNKKLLAMAMAGAMMIGAMATGVNVYADTQPTTTVTLTKATPNQYTMTIPSLTTMNADGTATALVNGLKVEGSNWDTYHSDVIVGIKTSTNEWKLKSSTTTDTIGFDVYSDAACTTGFTSYEVWFAKADACATGGKTQQIYVKPDATDLANAADATYTANIVFTANWNIMGDQ